MRNLTEILNTALIFVRFLTIIPLTAFIITQLRNYRKDDTVVWRVRRLTLVMAIWGFIGVFILLLFRLLVALGYDSNAVPFQLTVLIPTIIMCVMIWWALLEVIKINKHQ